MYRDLPDTGNVSMRCTDCGDGPWSATRGDYFWADPDSEVVCASCGAPMELGREVLAWRPFVAESGRIDATTVGILLMLAGFAYLAAHIVAFAMRAVDTVRPALGG